MKVKCTKCKTHNPVDSTYCKKCATLLPSVESLQLSHTKTFETPIEELNRGTLFAGRYEIIEELGKGGMGKVFRVCDTQINQELALKVLRPEIATDKTIIERFRNELKIARKITHKNICRSHDINEVDGTPYITMELVKGESLKNYILKKGHLSEKEAISLVKQVCEGLSEAHELGIVHRDLKSQNIMIDEKGQMKIMDFGIARSIEIEGMTQSGIIIGTPEYISPEQAKGEQVDHRTDIWSMGVVLYEMLTGELPFKGDQLQGLVHSILNKEPNPVSSLRAGIPKQIDEAVQKALTKDLTLRYQNILDFIQDLKRPPGTAIAETKKSIAVLPFTNMSADPEQEYFCDGMAEEIINALTRIKGLRVVARTSSFAFKDEKIDIRKIGEKLNVNNLLEGSVRKAGSRIRITAQLINVEDGCHLWSERYDRDLEDVFAIQDEITENIVGKLKLIWDFSGIPQPEIRPSNLEAYDLYLRGRYYLNKFDVFKAIDYYQRAIEIDPRFAPAFTSLAEAYVLLAIGFDVLPSKEVMPKARKAAQKALQIDPTLAEAYVSLGMVATCYDWDRKAAEKYFGKAIELNPNSASAHLWKEIYLTYLEGNLQESLAEIERAQNLDPMNLLIKIRTGYVYYMMRDFDLAISQFKKILDLEPNFAAAYHGLMDAYGQKKMYKEALEAGEKILKLLGKSDRAVSHLGVLGFYYAIAGQKDKAYEFLSELEEMSKKGYVSSFWAGTIFHGLGERDKAFQWFGKAFEERDSNLIYLTIPPPFDSLRSDLRFKQLMKKMGLENLLKEKD